MDPGQIESALLFNFASNTKFRDLLSTARTNLSIGILDKDEMEAEEATWEEIEPYIRVLGVSSKDIWASNSSPINSNLEDLTAEVPKIEMQINQLYRALQNILGKDMVSMLSKTSEEVENFENKFKSIREKQMRCLQAYFMNLEKIAKEIIEIQSLISENQSENLEMQELNLKIDIASLKRQELERHMENALYNPNTKPVLEFIRENIEDTLAEYTHVKEILQTEIQNYESNPQLKKLIYEYSDLLKAIATKQRDIDSLG